MTTMEKQYEKTAEGQTYDLSKEWKAHKVRMMDHLATMMDLQKVVYDGLSETWDTHGRDLVSHVSCSIHGGNVSCKVLNRLLTAFSDRLYINQFKATNEKMNGHIKVLRNFYKVVARVETFIKQIELTLDRDGEGALSSELYSEWVVTSKELSEHFAQVLEVCNVERYELLDSWEDFHIKGGQMIGSLPEGEDKKRIKEAWESMAIHMNTTVLNMLMEVRGLLDYIERDCYQSEYRLHEEMSRVFKGTPDN